MKPIVVRHPEYWRIYRGGREMLAVISLGDVIPGYDCEWCEEPAASHLYSRPESPADVIAVASPTEREWAELFMFIHPA